MEVLGEQWSSRVSTDVIRVEGEAGKQKIVGLRKTQIDTKSGEAVEE